MSDQSGDSSGTENLDALRTEAQRMLEEIKQFRTQAEDHLKAAENARKKADDDALYASQAKNNTETHAKAVSTFKGQVEAEFTTISTNKRASEELLQASTVGKTAIDADAKIINDRRKDIELSAQGIVQAAEKGVARLQEIEDSKNSIDAVRKETEKMRDEAIQARNSTQTTQKEVEQFSTQATGFVSKITEAHLTSAKHSGDISEILTSATTDSASLKDIITHLTKSDGIATGYEKRVVELDDELQKLLKKVEDLLPGATSASLASAFRNQKKRFSTPRLSWMITFIVCIVSLVAIGVPGFVMALSVKPSDMQWEEILRGVAIRMPLVIPLVWLAIYAGRNYMLSLRLEEEYAYKEAVSTAFEGYKREMQQIAAGDAANPTPLTTLCVNLLRAIAERPGRIYEGKQEDITLLAEVKLATAGKVEELRQKTVATR